MMYLSLSFLCPRLEHTKAVVLPELVELARDEGSTVRLAAFDTIINLLEVFDSGKLSMFASHKGSSFKESKMSVLMFLQGIKNDVFSIFSGSQK